MGVDIKFIGKNNEIIMIVSMFMSIIERKILRDKSET